MEKIHVPGKLHSGMSYIQAVDFEFNVNEATVYIKAYLNRNTH